jgi:type IV secretion system protein VirB5
MRGPHANPYGDSDPGNDSPARRGRGEWDDRIGSAVVQAANWRYAFFSASAALMLALAGLIYVANLPRRLPYVIEVDRDGPAIVRGEVGTAATQFTPSDLQVRYFVRTFVTSTRRTSSDVGVVKQDETRAYSFVTPRAHEQLKAYFHDAGDPLTRSQSGVVKVEIPSALKITDSTWQVDWVESHWDPQLTEPKHSRWRGLFRVQQRKVSAVDPENPLGIYIDEFHWEQVR